MGGGLAVAARCGCRQVSRDLTPPPYIPCCLTATLSVRIAKWKTRAAQYKQGKQPNENRKHTRANSLSLSLSLSVYLSIYLSLSSLSLSLSLSLARSLAHTHTHSQYTTHAHTRAHTHYRELQVVRMEAKLRSGQLPLSRITDSSFVGRKLDLLRTRLADGGGSVVTFSSIFLPVSVAWLTK